MKKALFIYNPNAGKGLLKPKLSDIIDIIVKAGYEVVVYPTQKYKDAYYKVKTFTEEYDRVICSGGDGTLDEVVTGMMKREKKDSGRLHPDRNDQRLCEQSAYPEKSSPGGKYSSEGREFPCDIGRFNGDVFVYIAAFGLFTDVSYETKQEMKNVLGHLAYVLEGATRIFDIPSYKLKVTHDGETIEDEFIYGMVTNSKSVGGFRNMIGKNVVFDDGEFEVTLIRTPKNPIALQEIVGALLSSQINTKHIYSFKTGEIHFESVEEIPWTLDGEFGGEHDSVCIKNAKQALKIVVPEEEQ